MSLIDKLRDRMHAFFVEQLNGTHRQAHGGDWDDYGRPHSQVYAMIGGGDPDKFRFQIHYVILHRAFWEIINFMIHLRVQYVEPELQNVDVIELEEQFLGIKKAIHRKNAGLFAAAKGQFERLFRCLTIEDGEAQLALGL